MEDILASIRKILSEDEAEPAKPEPAKAAPPPPPAPEPMIMEPEPEPEPVMAEPGEPVASIFDPEPEEEPAFNPEFEPPLQLTDSMYADPEPQYEPEQAPSFGQQFYDTSYGEGLVSDPVAAASGASIAQLAQAVARERAVALGNHGLTLEQLVREICTPILKHWLDINLPYMIERIVKQEIERIATRSDRT
ncbi:MAG: DUF2497 domain-containing protein [Rhodospirillaceae bacterium]|nr:DUF2497 domain-containing protein [Rhodospirillaceae bacterium]